MKTSDQYDPHRNLSILLIGQPGSGKTRLLLQFPHAYVCDADNNLGGAVRSLGRSVKFGYDTTVFTDDGSPCPPEKQFDLTVAKLNAAIRDPQIETVCLDSLTTLSDMLQNKILFEAKPADYKAGKAKMEIQHYGTFKNAMSQFIHRLANCGKTVVVTAHEAFDLDEQGAIMVQRPSIVGELKHIIGSYFTDVWQATTTVKAGEVFYLIRTRPTTKMKLKTSLDLPTEFSADGAMPEINAAVHAPIKP